MTSPDRLAELLDVITTWPVGVPVRAMEELLALGPAALPAVTDAVQRYGDSEERSILWPLVLLGELRLPGALPTLVRELSGSDVLLRVAAAEALAKIGSNAVPALREVVAGNDEMARLHAYGALGWIADDVAHAILLDALDRDHDLANVIGAALAGHHRRDDIPALYAAYRRCRPEHRADLAASIQGLHWDVRHPVLARDDWRLRHYIASTKLGIDVGWLGICAIRHKHPLGSEPAATSAVATLEALTATPPEPEPVERCEECGAPIEEPTGLPVCPETAVAVVQLQLDCLASERDEGLDDLFHILNDVEADLWELDDDEGDPPSVEAGDEHRDALEELAFLRATCFWCIRQGAEMVGPARARLLAHLAQLADRHGDASPPPMRRSAPKVGRNDPCPCGSGRKFKRCCG